MKSLHVNAGFFCALFLHYVITKKGTIARRKAIAYNYEIATLILLAMTIRNTTYQHVKLM